MTIEQFKHCNDSVLWIDGKHYPCSKPLGHKGYHRVPPEIAQRDAAAFPMTIEQIIAEMEKGLARHIPSDKVAVVKIVELREIIAAYRIQTERVELAAQVFKDKQRLMVDPEGAIYDFNKGDAELKKQLEALK